MVVPELDRFSDETLATGAPLIRPLWMLDPSDATAQNVDDQFMIGNGTLVAPVLE